MIITTNENLYVGESYSKEFNYIIDDNLLDCDIYLDFITPDTKKYFSEKLNNDENSCLLPKELFKVSGILKIQMVAYRGNNFVSKSDTFEFKISRSINAIKSLLS